MKFNFKKNWYYLIPVAIGGYLILKQFAKPAAAKVVVDNNNTQTNTDFPLQRGSINTTVGDLQTALNVALQAQGKILLVVDNNFGPKTQAALIALSGKSSVANQAELDSLKQSLK
jgi:peptidoglycan hydrolase-like protein with peptidoglycan-binding domain